MNDAVATVTTKGQVTIPFRPARHTLASIRGIVPPLPRRKSTDFEDQIEEAREEEADRIVRWRPTAGESATE